MAVPGSGGQRLWMRAPPIVINNPSNPTIELASVRSSPPNGSINEISITTTPIVTHHRTGMRWTRRISRGGRWFLAGEGSLGPVDGAGVSGCEPLSMGSTPKRIFWCITSGSSAGKFSPRRRRASRDAAWRETLVDCRRPTKLLDHASAQKAQVPLPKGASACPTGSACAGSSTYCIPDPPLHSPRAPGTGRREVNHVRLRSARRLTGFADRLAVRWSHIVFRRASSWRVSSHLIGAHTITTTPNTRPG